jgi:hypothetical protein
LSPYSCLPQGLARKENIRQWLSAALSGSLVHFALAESDDLRKISDVVRMPTRNNLNLLTKFCHASCSACMAALLCHSLLCACSTTISLAMEE